MFGTDHSLYFLFRFSGYLKILKRRRERDREQQSWRAAIAVAAQPRFKQNPKLHPRSTPLPLATKVHQVDVPHKYDKSCVNTCYRNFLLQTFVTPPETPKPPPKKIVISFRDYSGREASL